MSAWESLADWWLSGYTAGADREYEEQLLPLLEAEMAGCRRVLDIGCGDGQVARRIALHGARVVGIDPTSSLLAAAKQRGCGPSYGRGQAAALPVRTGSSDGAVLCLVLEHVEDLDAVVAEVARVLAPGGRCGVFLNHPMTQAPGSGMIEDHLSDPPERYWRIGPYLVESVDDELLERGVMVRFHHRRLSTYLNVFAEHGMLLERMVEPAPLTADALAASVPRSIYLRLRKS